MKTSSRKAKGRRLQNHVLKRLRETFGFTEDDARTAIMGEAGADIKLSKAVLSYFPYNIECKNQEIFTNIYSAYEQAKTHGKENPLVVIKMNNKPALAVLDLDVFLEESFNNGN